MAINLVIPKTVLILCVVACASFWALLIEPGARHQNEVVERARTASPQGTWIAKTVLEISSSPLVSAASYEVRVVRALGSGADKEFVTYAVMASGPTNIQTKWDAEDVLVISDVAENIGSAYKAQPLSVKVRYTSVPLQ